MWGSAFGSGSAPGSRFCPPSGLCSVLSLSVASGICAVMVIGSNSMAAGVPELGCGEEGNFSANSSILILMAVSAARPLGSSVLFQVNHEAALLWVSPMVLLLSCESMVVVRGP